jgi:hypothetical protein
VKNRFQSLPFKFNLQRYITAAVSMRVSRYRLKKVKDRWRRLQTATPFQVEAVQVEYSFDP